MPRMLEIVQLLCGLFVLYVAIGSLVGFALPPADPETPGCFPYVATFGVILSKCSSAAADLFWSFLVGWPRFLIIAPALVLTSVKASVKSHFHYWFVLNGIPFIPPSLELGLVMGVSFVYWRARSKPFAIGLIATLVGEILYLGWAE